MVWRAIMFRQNSCRLRSEIYNIAISSPAMKSRRVLAIIVLHSLSITDSYVPNLQIISYDHHRQLRSRRPTSLKRSMPSAIPLRESDESLGYQKPKNVKDRLWTYAYNIPKAARQSQDRAGKTRPVYSLVAFLQEDQHDGILLDVEEALERATIQAVRAASSVGDYRLIFKVVDSAIEFCQLHQSRLPARLFGEAIESISRTSCNVSKLKQMWLLSETCASLLREPMGAFELNTMIRALASRGKIRAALDLYQGTEIAGDAYSMSALMVALMDSIVEDQIALFEENMSPCWQYNEGRHLLEMCPREQLNNHVFAAALRLNERAGQVFDVAGQRHYVAKAAMEIIQLMKTRNVSPDVVTCSLVLSAFDKAYRWKAAVAFLDAMRKRGVSNAWALPEPNEYVYSAVISACARCNEYDTALQVLDQMRTSETVRPNTWVYNAALSACVGTPRHQQKRASRMALALLNQMQPEYENGFETAPDVVTFNTALAAVAGMDKIVDDKEHAIFLGNISPEIAEEWGSAEAVAYNLLQQMKKRGLQPDALTYHNAIRVARSNGDAMLIMLDAAVGDLQSGSSKTKLTGRASEGLIFVFNSALSAMSLGGDLDRFDTVLTKMAETGTRANPESIIHLLTAFGKSGNSENIPNVLQALQGDENSLREVKGLSGLDLSQTFLAGRKLKMEPGQYAAATKACLNVNDIDNALTVLSMMREKGFSPDSQTMQDIAFAYCRLATVASAEEAKIGRRRLKSKRHKRTLQMDIKQRVSAARARSAMNIALSLDSPSVGLLAATSSACCSAGMWDEGRMILSRIHRFALSEKEHSNDLFRSRRTNKSLSILPELHRSLLKLCASKGNATAAVAFVADIQAFFQDFSFANETNNNGTEFSSFLDYPLDEGLDVSDDDTYTPPFLIQSKTDDIGMSGEDWKLLLIAASKSGQWRLCLGTLQFLRPYLEDTHPDKENECNRIGLAKRYNKLARSLTAAILCFEIRNQYAWAIRAIDDWIEWSGRRPTKEAVLAAFRILAKRDQGNETIRLLQRVLQVPSCTADQGNDVDSYEEIICTGAVNALHTNGLYDDADLLYIHAYTQGYLPFSVERTESSNQTIVDLHGMNVAMAHSAVRIALQQHVLPETSLDDSNCDVIVVTGRGLNSAQRFRPVLRPEVQRMLLEEFYPPLSTTSIPGNMGALRVPAKEVKEWVAEQRQQKGARMLAIADVLKDLTSGERLRRSIEKTLRSDTSSDEDTALGDDKTNNS